MKLQYLDGILSHFEEQLSEAEKNKLEEKVKNTIESYPFNIYELRLRNL